MPATQSTQRGLLGDSRTWLITGVAGVAAYAATSNALVLWGGMWQLALLVGALIGLVSVVPLQGAIVALIAVVGGMLLAPPEMLSGTQPGATDYLAALVLAPLAGSIPGLVRGALHGRSRKIATYAMSAALVAWILANLWAPLTFGGLPPRGYGMLPAETLQADLTPGTYGGDYAMYLKTFDLMHAGQPYYSAMIEAWKGQASGAPLPYTAAGVRLPTFFWLWQILPSDRFTIVYLFLVLTSVGVASGALISGQLVGPRLAPMAALALAALALEVGFNTYVAFVDLPATSVALVGVALFLWSARTGRRWPLWAAIAVFTTVALTRELLVYLLAFGALSSLLHPRGDRLRQAVPWLAGLAVFAAGYVAHFVALQPYLDAASESVSYFNGGFDYLVSALYIFSGSLNGELATMSAFVLLGLAGAIASRDRAGTPFAVFSATSIAVPLLAMLLVGNESFDSTRTQILNYWGLLVIPVALSFWPAAALWAAKRRE